MLAESARRRRIGSSGTRSRSDIGGSSSGGGGGYDGGGSNGSSSIEVRKQQLRKFCVT